MVYGEGPAVTEKAEGGQFGGAKDVRSKPYTAETCASPQGDALYAILLGWPADKTAIVKSLATSSPKIAGRKVSDVTLLGYSGKLTWTQDEAGLHVQLPATRRANTPSP